MIRALCLNVVYHWRFIVVLPCVALVIVDHGQLTYQDLIVAILSAYLLARLLERIVVTDLSVLKKAFWQAPAQLCI